MLGNSLPPVFAPTQQPIQNAAAHSALSDHFAAPPQMHGGQPAPSAPLQDDEPASGLPVLQTVPPLAPIMAPEAPAETQAPPPGVPEVIAAAPTVPMPAQFAAAPVSSSVAGEHGERAPRSVVWRETVQPRSLGAAVTRGELDPPDEVQPAEWARRIAEKVAEAERIREWAFDLGAPEAPAVPLIGRPAPDYPVTADYPSAVEAYREVAQVVKAL